VLRAVAVIDEVDDDVRVDGNSHLEVRGKRLFVERPVAMNFYSKVFPGLGGALFFRNFNLGCERPGRK